MNYSECIENARTRIGNYCKACPECNGRACKNQMPGPGAKGIGDTAIRNYDKWKEIRVQMDTIAENKPVDTSLELFGKKFLYPFFAGPVGAVGLHYGDCLDDVRYNDILVSACAKYGIAAFTGDGLDSNVMVAATKAIGKTDGIGIPTVKPWNIDTVAEKMKMVQESKAFAVAMDVDAAGLPFLKNMEPPAGKDCRNTIYCKRCYDSQRSPEGKRGRGICNCSIESWRTCAGSVPGDSRGAGRDRQGSRGFHEDICRWRNPEWCRRIQGPGTRSRCSHHCKTICDCRLWRCGRRRKVLYR